MPSQPSVASPAPPPDPGPPSHVRDHVRRKATDAEARALASGLRLRILRMCLDDALTNREIAEVLERNPATVLHHVRTLVDTGYLEAEEPRRGRRGAREIPYRTTGKSWYTYTHTGADSMLEAFLSEIQSVPQAERGVTRMGLRLPPDQLEEFRERLHALIQEFHDRPRDVSAAPWSLFMALHPDTSTRRRPTAEEE